MKYIKLLHYFRNIKFKRYLYCRKFEIHLFVLLYFFAWPLVSSNSSFDHCVVCSSSIYGFWLPLWYLQTLLLTIVLSVLLRYTDSDCPFGIFKLFFWPLRCLFLFDLRILITPLVSSNSSLSSISTIYNVLPNFTAKSWSKQVSFYSFSMVSNDYDKLYNTVRLSRILYQKTILSTSRIKQYIIIKCVGELGAMQSDTGHNLFLSFINNGHRVPADEWCQAICTIQLLDLSPQSFIKCVSFF